MGNLNNDQWISQPFLGAVNSPMPAAYVVKRKGFFFKVRVIYYLSSWELGLRTIPYYGYGHTIYGIYGPTLKLQWYGWMAVFMDKLPLTQNFHSESLDLFMEYNIIHLSTLFTA